LLLALLLQLAQWERVQPPILHQGSWQSCDSAERVLQHTEMRKVATPTYYKSYKFAPSYETVVVWELHMGPGNEFGLYVKPLDGEDHTHDGPDNLLGPDYRVTSEGTWRGKRQWIIPSLHLRIKIVAAGGSRTECESFYITVERQ
jgi:hypothetical protein